MTKSKSTSSSLFSHGCLFSPLYYSILTSSYLIHRDSIYGQKHQTSTKVMTQVRKPGSHGKLQGSCGVFYLKTRTECLPHFTNFLKILPITPATWVLSEHALSLQEATKKWSQKGNAKTEFVFSTVQSQPVLNSSFMDSKFLA